MKKKNPVYAQAELQALFDLLGSFFAPRMVQEVVQVVEVSIPPEMFRKLIMLCHPDKHNNSELSQEVTRWLIEERGKQK